MTAVSAIYRPAAREMLLTTAAGSVAFPFRKAILLRSGFERMGDWLSCHRAVATITVANADGERLTIQGDEIESLARAIADAEAARDLAAELSGAAE